MNNSPLEKCPLIPYHLMTCSKNITSLLAIFFLIILGGCIKQQTEWNIHVKQQEKIIAKSTKAIELNPNDAEEYLNRGEAYRLIEKYDEAIKDFNKAIDVNPDYFRAYEGLADAYIGKNMIDTIEADSKKAETIDPSSFDNYKKFGFGYPSETTGDFIFPIFDNGERHRIGDLVLGSTTMKEVVNMLSPCSEHNGPTPISQESIIPSSGKVGKMWRNIKYTYSRGLYSSGLDLFFGFDKNKRLIFYNVRFLTSWMFTKNNESEEQENIMSFMQKYQFVEASRYVQKRYSPWGKVEGYSHGVDIITMRGEIMPCITADILIQVLASVKIPFDICYSYTCPTE